MSDEPEGAPLRDEIKTRVRIEVGDRLRLTRPFLRTLLAAAQAGNDHVVITALGRSDDGTGHELRLVVEPPLRREGLPERREEL